MIRGCTVSDRAFSQVKVRVWAMLETRQGSSDSTWVFPGEDLRSLTAPIFARPSARQGAQAASPALGFVVHSLRHSYGARLGQCGAGVFQIMRFMGPFERHRFPTLHAPFTQISGGHRRTAGVIRPEVHREAGRRQERRLAATVSATLKSLCQ